ncbi:MAG: prolyl oligopeptidase family serine peptidase [Bacteroidia bacterium]
MKHLILTLALFGLSLMLTAQEKTTTWTPEHSMEFRSITQTEISPDGKYVAYVVRTPLMEGEKSEYNSQIWVAATDGSFNYQYTRGEKSNSSPAFSPDGSQLAFVSGRTDKSQVFVMRLMGGEPEQISEAENGVSSFQWSPDGSKIAFVMRDPDTEEEAKAKKEKRDVILVDQQFKYNHLYTVALTPDAEGERKTQRLTQGEFHVGNFDWAPDGQEIAFSYAANPNINTQFLETDISVVPADSGAVRELVQRPGKDQNPKYSPDGSMLAFQSSGGASMPIGLSDAFVVAASGGTPKALAQTPNRDLNLIDWDKDGKAIIVAEVNRTSAVPIKVAVPEGVISDKADVKLPKEKAVQALSLPNGSGTMGSFSINDAGQMSATYQTTDQPMEVYLADINGIADKPLSAVNDKVEIPEMGKTEVIRWKSSHDGMEVEGLVTYPIAYEKGKKYPIILQVHGGPAGVFTQSFTGGPSIYMTQYFAQQGYIVLRPNPRGSTGYGKDFRFANFQDWGFGDYEDLTSGVDHLIKLGAADKDAQYLMGWSYGGYMTSWVVTQTDRFRAASMGAGLPNLVSMVTTTDIPDYLVAHMGGEFYDDYDTYEKHSAMYHIKNVKTPTQVIHGQNDVRVPFTQGQEFYVALKRMGVATEMVVYPRTPHGPREPKFLMDVSPRIQKWFEQF